MKSKMKSKAILISALFMGFALISFSQTLQFSGVKLISTTEETVPNGKIWKVDGIAANRVTLMLHAQSSAIFSPADQLIYINNNAVSVIQSVGTGAGAATSYSAAYTSASYAASATKLPLWLPELTTLKAGTNVTYISVVEFDVVP